MPHATESDYSLITINPLAPTFGAEVSGVDFSQPVGSEVFAEIKAALAEVFKLSG